MISSAKNFYTASCVCGSLTSNEFNWNMSCESRVVLHFFEVGWDRWRPDSGGLRIPFNALSGGPKESWLNSTLNSDKLEFYRTACGTRCCYFRLIRKISKKNIRKIITATHQPFFWGVDSREQGKMGCCAPRARRVPRFFSRSDFQDFSSPKSFSALDVAGPPHTPETAATWALVASVTPFVDQLLVSWVCKAVD